MNVAIIGRTEMLLKTAKLLHESRFAIKAIITSPASPESSVNEEDFELFAKEIGAYFICTKQINSLEEELTAMRLDIGVSINYSSTISQGIIDGFRFGILNAHLGDLPRYRGNATPNWAIINGEKSIPLCIHYMVGGELDSGDILKKIHKEIILSTKVGEIYSWMDTITPGVFLEILECFRERGICPATPQSSKREDALRCYPRLPEDSKIDWDRSNIEILRLINASSRPFSGAFSFYDKQKVVFEDAQLYEDEENYFAIPGQVAEINKTEQYVVIITGGGKLRINRIIVDGKMIAPTEVVTSIRKRFKSTVE